MFCLGSLLASPAMRSLARPVDRANIAYCCTTRAQWWLPSTLMYQKVANRKTAAASAWWNAGAVCVLNLKARDVAFQSIGCNGSHNDSQDWFEVLSECSQSNCNCIRAHNREGTARNASQQDTHATPRTAATTAPCHPIGVIVSCMCLL
jgi:hypothetical protein